MAYKSTLNQEAKSTLPIGIFDSGIGGLTVVKDIVKVLPYEKIIYFGDTARVPYGNKSKETIVRFAREDINFLLNFNVKAIVAACFTVSSNALSTLKKEFDIPIFGMINPGVEALKKIKISQKIVGIIGTYATIESKTYEKTIKSLSNLQTFSQPCPLFVPIAEEGWSDHKATYLIAEEYLAPLKSRGVNILIMGCTHYPILKGVIKKVMGNDIKLIEPGKEASKILKEHLRKNNLLRKGKGEIEIYLSDLPRNFKRTVNNFIGRDIKKVYLKDEEGKVRPIHL